MPEGKDKQQVDALSYEDLQYEHSARLEAYMKVIAESSQANASTLKVLQEQSAAMMASLAKNSTHSDLPDSNANRKRKAPEATQKSPAIPKNYDKQSSVDANQSSDSDDSDEEVQNVYLNMRGKTKAPSGENMPGTSYEHEDQSVQSDPDNSGFRNLEKLLCENANEQPAGPEPKKARYPILGGSSTPNWEPHEDSMKWYLDVANIELSGNELKDLKDKFRPSEHVNEHFSPPKVPATIWQSIKPDSADGYKQSVLFKTQEIVYTSICPLLTVLQNLPESDDANRELVSSAIQLICTSNLQLNRYRRSLIAPYIKKDFRKNLLSTPVKHNCLFGSSFERSAEDAIKEQANISKVITPQTFAPPRPYSRTFRGGPNQNQFFRAQFPKRGQKADFKNYRSSKGRGRAQASYRGRPRGHGFSRTE